MAGLKKDINVLIDIEENKEKLHDLFGVYHYDYINHGITKIFCEWMPKKLLDELNLKEGFSPYRNVYSSVNWNEAMTISNMTILGRKWRLPTVNEMIHIKDSFYNYTEMYWAIDEYNPDIPTIVYKEGSGSHSLYVSNNGQNKAYMLLVRDYEEIK